VRLSPFDEYLMQRKKVYGDGWDQIGAKIRAKIEEKVGEDHLWTHEMIYPLFKESGLDAGNPMFYSFFISDVSNGDYQYAIKTIHPTRGGQLSTGV
jgi:hypothetical protein